MAQKRSPDNSEWTNILKEPIFVAKGSEIRCASSFLDMKGMDQEIIQFESSGNAQDNSHTLLTQIYTVNDGFNGKTTSSDYIVRPLGFKRTPDTTGANMNNSFESWRVKEWGDNISLLTNPFTMLDANNTDTGMRMTLTSSGNYYNISLNITSGGSGYKTGGS